MLTTLAATRLHIDTKGGAGPLVCVGIVCLFIFIAAVSGLRKRK